MIKITNLQLNFDQLLSIIKQLDEPARIQVARTLLETQMDAGLAELIKHLAEKPPCNDISDADINEEVRAVRQMTR
jgi:hypothetical protein